MESWLKLFRENQTADGFTFLVGNKIDLDYREVSQEEGSKLAESLDLPYFEVSAKTGENLEHFFTQLIDITAEKTLEAGNLTLEKVKQSVNEIKEEVEAEGDNKVDETTGQMNKEEGNIKLNSKPAAQKKTTCC